MSNDRNTEQFRKLFIGGLSYLTDEDTLKSHFEQWGELVDVVVMKNGGKNGRSRGFGFVTYKDPESVDAAQDARPHQINDRTVETKRAMPRDEAHTPELHATTNRLFVGALKKEVLADDLKKYFYDYGIVTEAEIITWKESGESRGFGFVTFEDYDSVDKILLKKPHTISGKKCEVKKALTKEEARAQKAKDAAAAQNKSFNSMYGGGPMMGLMGDMRNSLGSRYDNYGYQDYSDRFGQYQMQTYGGGPVRSGVNYRSQPYSNGGGGGRMRRDY